MKIDNQETSYQNKHKFPLCSMLLTSNKLDFYIIYFNTIPEQGEEEEESLSTCLHDVYITTFQVCHGHLIIMYTHQQT